MKHSTLKKAISLGENLICHVINHKPKAHNIIKSPASILSWWT